MLHASATVGKLVRKYSGAEQEQSRDLQSRAERAEREAATLPFEVCLVATSLHPHSKFFLQPLYCHSSCLVAARMVPDIIPLPSGWHPDGMRCLLTIFVRVRARCMLRDECALNMRGQKNAICIDKKRT
jgi:hypothetical protein